MNWLWPGLLLLLGLLPLLVVAYIWVLRRRRRFAVRYSSLALVRAALPERARWRRHFPFALFLLALGNLVLALGRPVAQTPVPAGQATIILAIDVSRSMCSTDILPSRLAAAQQAALSYVRGQRPGTQIGIVAFAGFAEMIQVPTADQEMLEAAIDSLRTARRTAIGSAILESLDAIASIDPNVALSVSPFTPQAAPTPVPTGAYAPAVIVLLTDGVSNAGPLPLDAAQQALDRGIRVYTIGFGTENGSNLSCDQQFQSGVESFGGGSTGSGFRRGIDETTLKQIADMTGGDYYEATSAGELQDVFRSLPTSLITRLETTEISVVFAAAGALLAALAMALALLWQPLP